MREKNIMGKRQEVLNPTPEKGASLQDGFGWCQEQIEYGIRPAHSYMYTHTYLLCLCWVRCNFLRCILHPRGWDDVQDRWQSRHVSVCQGVFVCMIHRHY